MKCPNCGIEIRRKVKNFRRSDPQNRYLHGVVLPILAHHTGYTNDEMKAVIKWKFKIKQTSTLDTVEFNKFVDEVRAWASSDLGCYIPDPNEHEYQ